MRVARRKGRGGHHRRSQLLRAMEQAQVLRWVGESTTSQGTKKLRFYHLELVDGTKLSLTHREVEPFLLGIEYAARYYQGIEIPGITHLLRREDEQGGTRDESAWPEQPEDRDSVNATFV